MILKCSYCSGKMRVDDERLPVGKAVKVRCPHCKGIGLTARKAPAEPTASLRSAAAAKRESAPAAPPPRPTEKIDSSEPSQVSPPPSSPPEGDEFDEFRFPSEQEVVQAGEKARGTGIRIIGWIVASLAVILAFALIVNLVLTGPPR
jgi:predicted Zn finger-like uncharacterized protein